MATKDRTALKDEFKNGNLATGERFADLIDSMKVVQEPVADPAASGTSLSFIDSISQDADGKITPTKKTLDLANAHELNPFKGWYKTGDTLPTDGFDGAYLYFKDTSELTGQTTIYRWNGTTYADTGTVVDTSNVQTFKTGQAVNGTGIKDINGYNDPNAAGVLSAEAGQTIVETTMELETGLNILNSADIKVGKRISSNGGEYNVSSTNTPKIYGCTDYIEIGDGVICNHTIKNSGTYYRGAAIYDSQKRFIGTKSAGDFGDSLVITKDISSFSDDPESGADSNDLTYVRFNLYNPAAVEGGVAYNGETDGYAVYTGTSLPVVFSSYDGLRYTTKDKKNIDLLRECVDNYFDFLLNKKNKTINIVGIGDTGTSAGVSQIGDIFFNTSSNLLRQAISSTGSGTFSYETIPFDNSAIYISPTSYYAMIDDDFTEIPIAELGGVAGIFGVVLENKSEIQNIKNKHLKICLLGNSYTADCWRYVPFMLLNYGITSEIYLYYRGSGSLNDLNSQWNDYTTAGNAESDNGNHTRFCARIDTRKDKVWINYAHQTIDGVQYNTMSANDIVEIGNTIGGWDLVVLQQQSTFTDVDPDDDEYGRYDNLSNIIGHIQELCDKPFSLCWFEAYTRASHDSAEIQENSLANQKKIYERYPFTLLIPVASAVFSARTNETLAGLGDSAYHNLWGDDDVHLQEGLPCYIGALTVVQSLLDYFVKGKSVLNDTFRATQENAGSLGLASTVQTPYIGITESNCRLAQKAAILAVKNPFSISSI